MTNKTQYEAGDKVFHIGEQRLCTILDVYGDPINGNHGEMRLDLSGNTMISQFEKYDTDQHEDFDDTFTPIRPEWVREYGITQDVPLRLPEVNSKYGAPMGRGILCSESSEPLLMYLNKVELEDGYDNGGAYWGNGEQLWLAHAEGESSVQQIFVRGATRGHVMEQVQETFPEATFAKGDDQYWFTSSSGRVEFQLPSQCIEDCAHSGDCGGDVEIWVEKLADMLGKLNREDVIIELKETGAWSRDELAALTPSELNSKLIWIAANHIKESEDYPCDNGRSDSPRF